MEHFDIDVLGNLKFFLPQLFILAICIVYWAKVKGIDGFFLTTGSGLSFLVLIYHLFIKSVLWLYVEKLHTHYQFDALISITSFLSSMAFVAGFLILVMKQMKNRQSRLEHQIKQIGD